MFPPPLPSPPPELLPGPQPPEGRGGGAGCRAEGFGPQHPRPRAFSQSAVHTLERRERELEKVRPLGARAPDDPGWAIRKKIISLMLACYHCNVTML